MNDLDLEGQLRKSLQAADLPAAPTALRQMLADMPQLPTGRGRRGVGGMVLLAAAILVVGGLGAAGAFQRPNPSVAPPSPPRSSPLRT